MRRDSLKNIRRAFLFAAVVAIVMAALAALAGGARAQGTTVYPGSIDGGATCPAAVDHKFTSLTGAITDSATTVIVESTAGLPSTVVANIDSELLSCSVTNATTLTCGTRGFSNTSAKPHAAGATVRFPIAAPHVNCVQGATFAIQTKLGAGASPAASASTGHVLTKQADGSTQWAAPSTGTGTANQVLAGPTSGGAAPLTVRALVEADLPVASASAGGIVTSGAQAIGGTKTFQKTGAAAALILDRTDGKIGSFGAGGSTYTLAFDSSGSFKIESNSRANIAAGVFGTGATTRLGVDGSTGAVMVGYLTPISAEAFGARLASGHNFLFARSGASNYLQAVNDTNSAYVNLRLLGNPVEIAGTGDATAAQFDADATAGNTRLLLWDVSAGSLKRVKLGASGTGPGGVGKALYVD